MGIFYFFLVSWGVKTHKTKSSFLLPTSNKFAIKINLVMQLCLIFHKRVNKNKLKVGKFQGHGPSSFSTIKKTVTRVEGRRGNFVLFLSLFLSVQINFQYNLNSHKSLFIVSVNLFSSSHTHFFLSAIALFFSSIFLYKFHTYE